MLGTSTTTTFVESASGVTEGGRTGLTAMTTGVLFLLGIYAAGWQVMLKKFNLGVAYANRSAVVIWGILLAWLCLGETLSWTLAAGAVLIISGIILVSTEEDAHE